MITAIRDIANEKKFLIHHTKQLTEGCVVKHLSSGIKYKVVEVMGLKVRLDDGTGSYKSTFVTSLEMLKQHYVLLKFIDVKSSYQPSIMLDVKELQVTSSKGKSDYGLQYSYIINKEDNRIYRFECQHLKEESLFPSGESLITDIETGERITLRDEIILTNFYKVEPTFKTII